MKARRACAYVLTTVVLLHPRAAGAQGPAAGPAPAAAPAPTPAPPAQGAGSTSALEPQGFTYNSEGRRDPFVSLLRRGADTQRSAGARAAGLAGLGTGDIALKGTVQSRSGYVAILQGADSKSYIARTGDRLLDGTIRAITQNAMVILQEVNDPLSLEKEREVWKVLRQTEEAK